MIFKRKPAPVEHDPVIPAGWKVQVRVQRKPYGDFWEYRLTPPPKILRMYDVESYAGQEYKTKRLAIVEAVDMAEFIERNYDNKMEKWEKV